MTPEQQVEELYERCIYLERLRYDLEDKIEDILDFLVHTNITIEEMEGVQKIAYDKRNV